MIGASIGAAAYTALAIVNFRAWGWDPSRHQLALVFAALGCMTGGAMAARDRVFSGGLITLISVWCEVHLSLLTSQQFPSPSMLATSAILVGGALLLLPRHSLMLAAGSVILTWPLVLLSPAVQATGVTSTVIYWLTAHAVVTIAVWSLVSLGFSIVDGAFVVVLRKERELAETINRSPDGILVIDSTERLHVINPAAERILGVTQDECLGRDIGAILNDVTAARGDAPDAAAARTSGERPHSWSLAHRDGRQIELEITWRAMDEGRRQLVLRDVSERVRADHARRDMELQLAHAQRLEAVGQLAGGIAHDFNNILTIIGASTEVLRSELRDASAGSVLDDIVAAQERGATLTRQLLAFARRDTVQPRVFDLSQQVLTLQRLLQRVAGEQTRICCDVVPDCRVRADVGQVEQALVNLVTNARDAMPSGGTCTLSVGRGTNDDGESLVWLRVHDEGVGMDSATSLRAFEPFFTTKPRGRGTGLGLAAVHGMVMQSGGRADITSALGSGTTVTLEFPFVNETPTVRQVHAVGEHAAGGGMILVAEDDDGTRATVARMLQRLGYQVMLAPDGLQALRMAEANLGRIDLLLTDVMMPGLSGPQLASRLQQQSPGIPVVFMSGYPEDALAQVQGLHLETDFVAKPFTSAILGRRLSEKLGAAVGLTQDA
jgi:two-component system, cell cycle sensor histidine kinase and response regulator CckA